jgi:hypothetical protein
MLIFIQAGSILKHGASLMPNRITSNAVVTNNPKVKDVPVGRCFRFVAALHESNIYMSVVNEYGVRSVVNLRTGIIYDEHNSECIILPLGTEVTIKAEG